MKSSFLSAPAFTLLLCLFSISTQAQMHISTDLREDFDWDKTRQEWTYVDEDETEKTFLHFNKELTMMEHVTPTITSMYNIKNAVWKNNDQLLDCEATSDVGNHYYMIVDLEKKNVRFVGKYKGAPFMVRHQIKKVWYDGK